MIARRWCGGLWVVATMMLLVACGEREAAPKAPAGVKFDGPPLLVAHYMPWYQTPAVSGSWRHWAVNEGHIPRRFWHDPEKRNKQGWRDIASVFYPVIGPYDSADPELCEYHILLAKAAGIDAFVADWYGPESFEDQAFAVMRRMAERLDFKVFICWEDQAEFPPYSGAQNRAQAIAGAASNMKYLAENWFNSPAYLTIAKRPVLTNFAWGDPGSGMEKAFSAAEWNDTILAVMKTRPVFIHDFQPHRKVNDFTPYESVMPWGSTYHMENDNPEFWRQAETALGKGRFSFLAGTVLPGFDNRGVGGWGAQGAISVTPYRNGKKLQDTFDACLAHHPKLVQIATWNDLNEGATIEPVRIGVNLPAFPQAGYGYQGLELVQQNAAKLKGGVYDSSALRIPARIYACRKLARAAKDTGAAAAAIDVARDLFLAQRFEEARVRLEEIYRAFPAKLRADKDLAVYVEPSGEQVPISVGWIGDWEVNDCLWRFQDNFLDDQRAPHPGRRMILGLHPVSKDKPCTVSRRVKLGPGARLTLTASSTTAVPNVADFVLRVKVDGEIVYEEVIAAGPKPSPAGWKPVKVDLGRFSGKEVTLMIECAAGGKDPWNHEHAFLADVKLTGVARQ